MLRSSGLSGISGPGPGWIGQVQVFENDGVGEGGQVRAGGVSVGAQQGGGLAPGAPQPEAAPGE